VKDTIILKKNPDIVSRTIEEETILMPLYKTSDEINCIYTLNDVAARIWELIDGRRNLAQIKKKLLEEFEASEKEMDKELNKFFEDLQKIKAIKLK
jgi:hypothetical protein